ncbi:MAG TPA: hypothetical protein VFO62_05990, partial [Candidatus Binatia bacterium]|nr:hypothetical protein [Candidatus Binatia bacterium]
MIESVRSARLLFELRRGARRTPEALHALQGELLRRTVAHANGQVPFYRRLWKGAGVDCEQVRSTDDLRRLPIISSDQVRAAAESGELMAGSSGASDSPRFSTSGSSGRPLLVPRGDVEARLWRVGGLRMQLEHGFRWSDTTVQFDPAPGPPHPLQSFGVARTVWIHHELTLDEQLARLIAARAQVVLGNVSVLRRIARALTERNVALATPKMVFSTAEVL